MGNKSGLKDLLNRIRYSDEYAIFIVFSTLLVDSMLLLAPAPILPIYLFDEKMLNSTATTFYHNSSANFTADHTRDNTSSSYVPCQENNAQKSVESESLSIGILLASKPAIQSITNLAAGTLADYIGHDVPMFVGYVLLTTSSLVFAFGRSYAVLLLARCVQGIGSSGASVVGFAMLAKRFKDDEVRGRMISIVVGGFGAGYLIGPSFASVTYQYAGKEAPFVILAGMSCLVGILQFCSASFDITPTALKTKQSSVLKLLKDPYILLASSALMLNNLGIATLETGLPIWMVSSMCASKWMLGVASLPISLTYLVFVFVLPRFIAKEKRWLFSLLAFYISVIGYVAMPFCKSLAEIIGPGVLIGMSVGLVDISIIPVMGTLADTRHGSMYGSTYAISDSAFCVAAIVGPLLAGAVIRNVGFKWLMFILVALYLVFTPLLVFLRNPPPALEETMTLLDGKSERGITEELNINCTSP